MKRILGFLAIVALPSCDLLGPAEDERRLRGFYILDRVDGALLPVNFPPQQGCNRTLRKPGTLTLAGGGPDTRLWYSWSVLINAECDPVPPGVDWGAEDGGGWSRHGKTLSFRSREGMGEYPIAVEERSDSPPVLTLAHLGNSYRFRRIDDPTNVVYLKFVDQLGVPVARVIFRTELPYGLEGGGQTSETGEFGTSGHIGEWTISFTPPEGYAVPPSQANPFVLTVPEEPVLYLVITLTKL